MLVLTFSNLRGDVSFLQHMQILHLHMRRSYMTLLYLLSDWIGLDSCLNCMGKAEPRLLCQASGPAYLYMYMSCTYTQRHTQSFNRLVNQPGLG